MANIKVLDCTLRDGGYCNHWKFGKNNIKKINEGLVEAGIDIIELGFVSNKIEYDEDMSKYSNFSEAAATMPLVRSDKMFVCMINYGEYDIEEIPLCNGSSVDGIRVAFHKQDSKLALEFCQQIQRKGYKVFVQPMVTLNYSDEEFLHLIKDVNNISPYAFYIVDSFGVMKRKDLIRLFYMVENNLSEKINIGYHSHNNMQLAYSNAQTLVDLYTKREVIIDSCVFGMGRGAGNLNTELFVEYLNDTMDTKYDLKPLLTIIDDILNTFYQQNYWGYSLPNYLSAKHAIHPNYAGYLDAKKTLTVENLDEIFSMMDNRKKAIYDKAYIEELYKIYMAKGESYEVHLSELKSVVEGKKVLIIAPGISCFEEKDKIKTFVHENDVISFSVNFDYKELQTNYIFLSNLRRYREMESENLDRCIVTSNIPSLNVYLRTKYSDLLNSYEAVEDNAGLMLIKFLIRLRASKIYIAGIDGYTIDYSKNYVDKNMNFFTRKATCEAMNIGLNMALKEFASKIEIEFLTTPKYVVV